MKNLCVIFRYKGKRCFLQSYHFELLKGVMFQHLGIKIIALNTNLAAAEKQKVLHEFIKCNKIYKHILV